MQEMENKQIHVIYKTHLDVGFTDFAGNVGKEYLNHYIPKALQIARDLRESGVTQRFIWTTGSWIIYEYLEKADARGRQRMEEAIDAGDIRWHSLPFTTHTEYMDASLFRYGLSLSKRLDERFGITTIAAKMSDVPGHTRAMIPLLLEAGTKFLHIGCNPALTPPSVPPAFCWKDRQGSEITVMYQVGYGSYMEPEGLGHALMFEHTNDNLGPQTMQEVIEGQKKIQEAHPNAKVSASDLNSFAAELCRISSRLPVIEQEIGDTWIHGVGTDPKKTAQFRVLQRARKEWYDKDNNPKASLAPYAGQMELFSRSLLMIPEHTWGMDIKTHLRDTTHYEREGFEAVRKQDNFLKVEASWEEQREYITGAMKAIRGTPMYETLEQKLEEIIPQRPDLTDFDQIDLSAPALYTDTFEIMFDGAGSLCFLRDKGRNQIIFDENHIAGRFIYQAFTDQDYERFHRQYLKDHAEWAIYDNGKPGLPKEDHEVISYAPVLRQIFKNRKETGYLVELGFDEELQRRYGCPKELYIQWTFNNRERNIEVTLQWFDKAANRLPEAYWLCFHPVVPDDNRWMMVKMGQEISPLDVIEQGNRKLHCIEEQMIYRDPGCSLSINSLDAPLVAPGRPSLLEFNQEQPDLSQGMAFHLFNNVWGTNFPMWYEEDACFRFIISY